MFPAEDNSVIVDMRQLIHADPGFRINTSFMFLSCMPYMYEKFLKQFNDKEQL